MLRLYTTDWQPVAGNWMWVAVLAAFAYVGCPTFKEVARKYRAPKRTTASVGLPEVGYTMCVKIGHRSLEDIAEAGSPAPGVDG